NLAAYGATATVAGNVTLPDTTKEASAQPIVFDLRGQARHVDLRKMPGNLNVPPAETDVNAEYHAAGSVMTGKNPSQQVSVEATFMPSTVAGARIAAGGTAGF